MSESTPYTGPITAEHQIAWLAAYQEYLRLNALACSAEKFGPLAALDQGYEDLSRRLEDKNGAKRSSGWPQDDQTTLTAAGIEYDAAYDALGLCFLKPRDMAAIALVTMPAPDLDAALAKISIVEAHELDNLNSFPGKPFDYIAADLARFAPGGEA